MGSIPKPLAARFELLQDLGVAYDLLDGLPPDGSEAERAFLQNKIDAIDMELEVGVAEALALIEAINGDSRAWLAASFRYHQGYTWAEVAEMTGDGESAIKARVYRAFRQVMRKENNT